MGRGTRAGGGHSSGGSHSHSSGSRGSSHSHSSFSSSSAGRSSRSSLSSSSFGRSSSVKPKMPSTPKPSPAPKPTPKSNPAPKRPEPRMTSPPPPPRPMTPPPIYVDVHQEPIHREPYRSGPVVPPPPPRQHVTRVASPPPPPRRRWRPSILMSILVVVVCICFLSVLFSHGRSAGSSIAPSTTPRTKAESGNAYISDCIEDELGWISNTGKVSSELKTFYQLTGCQPYLILMPYSEEFDTEEAREEWSKNYYDTNFTENQNVVLYTYFDDGEGTGNDTLFVGTQSGVVFDSEAQEIFWNYLDYYWEASDLSEDEMFIQTFNDTAERIMTVTTTENDVKQTVAIVIGLIAVGAIVIILVSKKFKREKEKAQETIDILNSPLNNMGDATSDLADKYTSDMNRTDN